MGKCYLLNSAFEKTKTYFHWLWENKGREAHKSIVSKKNSESGVITQTLLISVSVMSARRLGVLSLMVCRR